MAHSLVPRSSNQLSLVDDPGTITAFLSSAGLIASPGSGTNPPPNSPEHIESVVSSPAHSEVAPAGSGNISETVTPSAKAETSPLQQLERNRTSFGLSIDDIPEFVPSASKVTLNTCGTTKQRNTFITDTVTAFRATHLHKSISIASITEPQKANNRGPCSSRSSQVVSDDDFELRGGACLTNETQHTYRENLKASSRTPSPGKENIRMAPSESQPRFQEDSHSTMNQEDMKGRKDQKFFASWGAPAARSAPKSQPRTVIITEVPTLVHVPATAILSLVFGGAIDRIRYNPGDNRAFVTFTTGDGAKFFFDRTANGLLYNKSPLRFMVMVDINKDDEPVSSRLRTQLECGASRVVRVNNCPADYSVVALERIAIGDKNRELEAVIDKPPQGPKGREVVFRFMNVDAAVAFLSSKRRDEDFITADVMFGEDPCAKATNIHYD